MKNLLLMLLFLSVTAHASFKTGNDLLMSCESDPNSGSEGTMSLVLCIGYISGYIDSIQTLYGINPKSKLICLPPGGMSGNQQMLIVTKYLRENPKELHKSARSSIFIALSKAFPCK